MEAPDERVTCVIPVHNGGRYLRQAIDSVLAQNTKNVVVLVIDDGSTDDSVAIACSYPDRVHCLSQARGGPAAARNHGARSAETPYLAFLDQDDWWAPDKLARQLGHFARRPDLDVSIGHVQSVWADEQGTREADQPRSGIVPGFIPGTMLVRASAFARMGGFDNRLWYVDGLDWFARALDHNLAFEILPDVLLFHRVHADNLSRRGGESRSEALQVLRAALARRRQGLPIAADNNRDT